ncbi:MAG: cysteine desulfurase family protein [Sandaracinaceae bacterium]
MSSPVYMDHHSTTPVDPRVLEAMLPYFGKHFGNASSRSHAFGWAAEDAVDAARAHVRALLAAPSAKEIVFTSGATESDNLAIKGVLEALRDAGRDHVVTCVTEHKAVLDAARHVEHLGARVTRVRVDREGRIDLEELTRAIDDRTALVSVMLANNEVGTLAPIAEIANAAHARGALMHCDAAQGLGLVPFDVDALGVDLASVSAHKMYGAKGVGALFVRSRNPRVRLVAQMDGGGHERAMRSGTLNVPGIVGLGEAARLAAEERDERARHVAALRDRLHARLTAGLDRVQLNGPPLAERHPGNLNVSFEGVAAEPLMLALKDVVAVSSGAACSSATVEPSYVLRAMGHDVDRAHRSLRFGLGKDNTESEVDTVADAVIATVKRLRAASPLERLEARGIDPETT